VKAPQIALISGAEISSLTWPIGSGATEISRHK
jgi:hypothetical protein